VIYFNKRPGRKKHKQPTPTKHKATTMVQKKIEVYFDGACRNVPEINMPMGIGVAVFIDGELCLEHSRAVHYTVNNTFLLQSVDKGAKRGTSNIAEWKGATLAFEIAQELALRYAAPFDNPGITVYSDSELITRRFNGVYMINQGEFLRYERIAKKYAQLIPLKHIVWIPRERNKIADKLSKIGLKKEFDHAYFNEGLPIHNTVITEDS